MRVNDLVRFIKERESIRLKKEAGKSRPWTRDPILDRYRFCNVHREDDAVSRWMRNTYYPSFEGNPDIWFAAVVARLLNNPESLDDVAIQHQTVLPWKPAAFQRILDERKANGEKTFNPAYIVSTNGVAMEKVAYLVSRVLGPLWAARSRIRSLLGRNLATAHSTLMDFDGLGSFIAAQVVADLKYMEPLSNALDWHTFAASGPGSRRGLNRVLNRALNWPVTDVLRESDFRYHLELLHGPVNKALAKAGWQPLHAQDLQNCLCEFDKYERARLGEGTPKQIYKEKVDG